jgi:hypothetical protein
MRTRLLVLLVSLLVGLPVPRAVAQDAEALRRELEDMRRRFDQVQQEYRKAMEEMAERLRRLEARPQGAAEPPAVVQAPPASPPPSTPEPLTVQDLARPRPPFSLYGPRGPGQLLFDIGIVGDFVGNLTQRSVDKADAGTFAGRENRFFPREVELSLFGQIDPYARGEVRLEAAEEFEDGVRELHVGLAEAHLTLLTVPGGFQPKLGRVRNRFGLLNERHREALPQVDQPNVLTRFLGEEGLNENGAEVTWIAPLPFYLQGLVGVFNGDNEVAFGRGTLKQPLLTGRVRTFLELGDVGALQVGGSAAAGWAAQEVSIADAVAGTTLDLVDNHRSILAGLDVKYTYTPEGWQHPLLTLAGEALMSRRRATVVGDPDGDGIESTERRTRNRFGWYAYAEVQPWKRWLGGVRYDNTQFPLDPGREWAVEPYLAFMPSEFLRFRLAYKHTERSHRNGLTDTDASARLLDELLFQATFFLGAHPAHPF